MKRSVFALLAIAVLSGLSACTSYDYYTAGLNRTNLSEYRTFAWMPPARNRNASANGSMVADAKIKDAATAALQAKGLTLNQRNPDIIVSYSTAVGKGTRTYYYPEYYGYGAYPGFGFGLGWGGWGGWGRWYRPYYYYGSPFVYGGVGVSQEQYKEGTLIIDLIDRHSRRVVWRGFGVGEVHHNPQKDIDALPEVVNGILDQLSLAPSSAAPAGRHYEKRAPRARRGGYMSPASNRSI